MQKLIKVGNSLAVTIPKHFITSLNISEEQPINVQLLEKKGKIMLDFTSPPTEVEQIVDPEVYKVAKQLLKRYLPAFKELAKK